MTQPPRTLETIFRRRVVAARVATGLGIGLGLAVAMTALLFEARETRAGLLIVGAAFIGTGRYWAKRLYRCSRCEARIMPGPGAFFGSPPVRCPKCQQKLTQER